MCNEKTNENWIEEWTRQITESDYDKLMKLIQDVDHVYCGMVSELNVDNDTKKDLVCAMKNRTILEKAFVNALCKSRN